MSPLIHALIAWIVAVLFLKDLNERRLVVFAGFIPDLDGVFILWNMELFAKYHHTIGHSLLFGLPMVLLFTMFSKEKLKIFIAGTLAFSLHLVADIVGSNWPIYPLFPFSDMGVSAWPWMSYEMIYGVLNPVVFFLVIFSFCLLIYLKKRSPLEFFSHKWDEQCVKEIFRIMNRDLPEDR